MQCGNGVSCTGIATCFRSFLTAALETIGKLGAITKPDIECTRISGNDLDALATLTEPKQLILPHRKRIGGEQFAQIASLKNLVHLKAGDSGLTDGGIDEITKLTPFRFSDTSSAVITDERARKIEKLTELWYLSPGGILLHPETGEYLKSKNKQLRDVF
jgi:hypothetical protein